jgi:hypothetical protein
MDMEVRWLLVARAYASGGNSQVIILVFCFYSQYGGYTCFQNKYKPKL